ncbi:MAG TPA: multicopper oxidase domain-containing protein, partial [Burkholderiales bacterium]|nr:multicopper oxidase domain-containing protein [Burkholderiales bacterium]
MNTLRRRLLAASVAAIASGAGYIGWMRRAQREPAIVQAPLAPDPLFPNPLHVPGKAELNGIADVAAAFTLVGTSVQHEILRGKPTTMLAYALEHHGRTLINPLLRAQTGANLRVRYWNALDEISIVHWHGLKNDTNNDGHPHYAVGPGATYDYQFTVANRAGTYWYHPHPHHLAGKQTYLGLAGLFVVEDHEELALERALDLELGVTDIPLLIQDRSFAADGSLAYAPGAREHFHGYCGDTVLMNLTANACLNCDTRLYRFRLVNGSNARVYRLAFMQQEHALDFDVIGGDGGLLEKPQRASELFLSPGERADVLVDLRAAAVGERIILASLPFDAMQMASRRTADTREPALNGTPLELMLIRVIRQIRFDRAIPETLTHPAVFTAEHAGTRLFKIDQVRGVWRINGGTYRMTETAFAVKRGTREVWEFRNPAPGMQHPI